MLTVVDEILSFLYCERARPGDRNHHYADVCTTPNAPLLPVPSARSRLSSRPATLCVVKPGTERVPSSSYALSATASSASTVARHHEDRSPEMLREIRLDHITAQDALHKQITAQDAHLQKRITAQNAHVQELFRDIGQAKRQAGRKQRTTENSPFVQDKLRDCSKVLANVSLLRQQHAALCDKKQALRETGFVVFSRVASEPTPRSARQAGARQTDHSRLHSSQS
mmetsp:Transcript_66159/g.96875  ORF Transcript_66159/g.96875 Transcript_66159/m.96875 type:complete len:226 (+) Transcript_66159:74-751(+)